MITAGRHTPPANNNTKDFIASHVLSLRPNLINQFRFAYVYFDWSLINDKRGPTLRDMGAAIPISARVGYSPDRHHGKTVELRRKLHGWKCG